MKKAAIRTRVQQMKKAAIRTRVHATGCAEEVLERTDRACQFA
jgi:hypothetical protein